MSTTSLTALSAKFKQIAAVNQKIKDQEDALMSLWAKREQLVRELLPLILDARRSGVSVAEIAKAAPSGFSQGQIGYYELVAKIMDKPGSLDDTYVLANATTANRPEVTRPDGSAALSLFSVVKSTVRRWNKTYGVKTGKKTVESIIDGASSTNEAIRLVRELVPSVTPAAPSVDALVRIAASNLENAATHHVFPAHEAADIAASLTRIEWAVAMLRSRTIITAAA